MKSCDCVILAILVLWQYLGVHGIGTVPCMHPWGQQYHHGMGTVYRPYPGGGGKVVIL